MKNLWTTKNPFLSLWMSGANAAFGAARSRAIAEAHRQAAVMMSEFTRQAFTFWGISAPATARKRKRKAR